MPVYSLPLVLGDRPFSYVGFGGYDGGAVANQYINKWSFTSDLLLLGDANYDGHVNFDDLVALAQHYNSTAALWTDGDFNVDRVVDFADLVILAQHYNSNSAASGDVGASFEADWALAQSLVPEPVAFVIACSFSLLMTPRHHRRNSTSSRSNHA